MGHFTATECAGDLNFISFRYKLSSMSQLCLEIVVIGIGLNLNLFHFHLVLRLFALFLFFGLLIPIFTKIDNFTNWWVSASGDLHEIKSNLLCSGDGIHQG